MNWGELTVCDSLHGQGLKDLDGAYSTWSGSEGP